MTAQQDAGLPPPPTSGVFVGTGRRKSAVARVRLTPGEGKILINDRALDQYFHEPQEQGAVRAPFEVTNTMGRFDVTVRCNGGGHSGQAGACLLGIARALMLADKRYEAPLRSKGFLTRDSRIVERKKYGRRKARRRFQFSKR
jgi:small subunit ribosomal protein S9